MSVARLQLPSCVTLGVGVPGGVIGECGLGGVIGGRGPGGIIGECGLGGVIVGGGPL